MLYYELYMVISGGKMILELSKVSKGRCQGNGGADNSSSLDIIKS